METAISYFATVASLVLAVIAIWLSLYFYKQSNALAESTKEASKEIKSGVERLEKLFDKLYEGTFSVMKDTVSDMRKHIWPSDEANAQDTQTEIDKRTEEKLEKFRREMSKEVASIIERQKKSDGKLEATKEELQQLVEKAINGYRKVEREAKEENIRDAILKAIFTAGKMNLVQLVDLLRNKYSQEIIMQSLNILLSDGDIILEERIGTSSKRFGSVDSKGVTALSSIKLTGRGQRALARSMGSPES